MQCINQSGTREGAGNGSRGSSLGVVVSDNAMEIPSIGGPQTQNNLLVNGDFASWTGEVLVLQMAYHLLTHGHQ